MKAFNAILLKTAREQMGFSQAALAERIGVRQAVLSKYENGTIMPSDDKLDLLCTALEYPLDFFKQEIREIPSGLVFHRKRSSLPASIRTRVEAEVRLRMMDVIALANTQGTHDEPQLLRRTSESPEEMARLIRKKWRLGDAPIGNMIETLENHGIVVIQFDFGTDKLDGFFLADTDSQYEHKTVCIALNSNPAFGPDRNRFTLAHELGHVLLHAECFPAKELEAEADAFASEFLAPSNVLTSELKQGINTPSGLAALKKRWGMSFIGLIYRAHRAGILSDSRYRRACIWIGSMGYRRHEPECGVPREHARTVAELLGRVRNMGHDLCELLHLTKERLDGRYPWLELGFLTKGDKSIMT